MSTHNKQSTPPPDLDQSKAHLESQRSTKPNKGSSASGQLLTKVQRENVLPGITVDMQPRRYCHPKDMIRFLLALCRQGDSSATPISHDEGLDKCLEECSEKVTLVARLKEMQQKLDEYKSSSSVCERDMYPPFADAMNYALERLSTIKVDGLPEPKVPIVFVPCDKGVSSDRDSPGSSFKPDLAIMTLEDACKLYGLDKLDVTKVSEFVSKVPKVSSVAWKTILSVAEMKRKKNPSRWPTPGSQGPQDADRQPDGERDASQRTTPVSSATLVSSKRSAGAAGMDANSGTPDSKRQWTQKNSIKNVTQPLADQAGIYAAEKFSDSFSISHVLNLLVEDDLLWISWIDREGAIFSQSFSFFGDLPLALVLLLVLQRFGRRQWGYISELTADDRTVLLHPMSIDGTLSKEEVGVNFHPEDKVHSSWSLLGRATTVVGASTNGEDGNGDTESQGVAKGGVIGGVSGVDSEDIQHTKGRAGKGSDSIEDRREVDGADPTEDNPSDAVGDPAAAEASRAYNQARDAYREAYSNLAKAHNLVLKVSWPEASRPSEWEIIGRAQTLSKNDKFIKDHIPVVKYARELGSYSTHHIRKFLNLPADDNTGTRALRLTVMKRLRPIYDLDGKQFWTAFWQCVACHYRLWMNGIYHGDISFNNLMYDILAETGELVGIVNDYDLATWVNHSATNSDRTGTIPFMAIDLLDGGLNDRTPRLYRHDVESFVWVLTYITLANIEYKDCTIKISPPAGVKAWFRDDSPSDREAHISSKRLLPSEYGHIRQVCDGYFHYLGVVQQIIQYWGDFHKSLRDTKYARQPRRPGRLMHIQEPGPSKPKADDNPTASLKLFITTVEKSLGEPVPEEFTEVKSLRQAIDTPITIIETI